MTTPKLVLMPGLDGSGVLFRPLLAQLPRDLDPIVISYPPKDRLGYDELLPSVWDRLPTSAPFVLLGESFSGPLSLKIAARNPPGLRGVILCASFVRNPLGPRWNWLRHLVSSWMFYWHPQFAEAKMLLAGYSTPVLRTLLRDALADVSPKTIAHRLRAVLQVDVRTELAECPVPLLYLRGTRDRVVPSRNADEIVQLRPDTRIIDIDAPHLVIQTKTDAAVTAISHFVREMTVNHL